MYRRCLPVLLLLAAVRLSAQQPVATPELRNLTARAVWPDRGEGFDVQLRFISEVPLVAAAQAGAVTAPPEPYACNNHRLDLHGLTGGGTVTLTLAPLAGKPAEKALQVAPPAPYPAAPAGSVALTVTEPSGRTRSALPVTSGVPLAKGALYRADNVRLTAGSVTLPLQSRAEARWEDGSIKWLLIDTQLDLEAGQTAALVLHYGGAERLAAAGPVKLTELSGRSGLVMDSGALRAVLSLPDTLELRTVDDKLLARLAGELTDTQGQRWQFAPESYQVLEGGPLRAAVRLTGHYRSGERRHFFGGVLLTLYAGKDYARVDHLFGNDLVDDNLTAIRSLNLDLATAAAPARASLGVLDAPALEAVPGVYATQWFDDLWIAGPPVVGKPPAESGPTGKRLAGLARTETLAVAVKDFWQNYPKSLALTSTGLRVGICPQIDWPDLYANKPDEEKLYYYLRDGNYTFRRGLLKRHELWLGPAARLEELGALAARHATASAPAEYYQRVQTAGDLLPAKPQQFAMYDEILSGGLDRYLEERERSHEYGLMNYGDWWGERGLNWGNEEYDLQVGMLQQYLRTGDRRFFYVGEAASRHNTEIDTIHWAAPPSRLPDRSVEPMPGEIWVHSMGHTGGYYPRDYKGMEVYGPGYATNRGHMWTGGNFLYGMLSGDPLVLESARLAADWMAGPNCTNFDYGNAREPGWMTMAVMSAFRATRDPYYLNAADIMLTKVHQKAQETRPEYGLYYHKLPNGHCDCPDDQKHYGEAGFMAGVLMTAMKRFYQETGREQVADDIVGIAHLIRDTMWVPAELGFRYTSCPKTTVGASSGGIIDEGLAFAANRTGDEELREIVRLSFANAMLALQGSGGGGKSAGYMIHSMPGAMCDLARFPGLPFDQVFARQLAEARSPALATLPTLMPNPDFEEGVTGWVTRTGFKVEPTDQVVHGGRGAARVTGTGKAQNEYLVTRYECGPPWEIMGLQPGRTYRLSAWLRVDEITPGTPAPNLRCALRDKGRTRDAFQTSAYDLARLGTWQRLAGEFTCADYTTSAYVAVNMNTREPVSLVMYADDINLVSAESADLPQYCYPAARAEQARLQGLKLTQPRLAPQWQMAEPAGKQAARAAFAITTEVAGEYRLWLRGRRLGQPAEVVVAVDGKPAGKAACAAEGWQWLPVGKADQPAILRLPAGSHEVTVQWPAGSRLGLQKIALSNDASAR